jgi:hypothetical protein
MNKNNPVGAYERRFLEMLLRHELPEHCDVRIEVTPKGGKTAEATFAFDGDATTVKANIKDLGLKRLILPSPPCW